MKSNINQNRLIILILILIIILNQGKLLSQQPDEKQRDEKMNPSIYENNNATEENKKEIYQHYYFYKEDDTGSRAFHTPWNNFIEGGFGAMHNMKIDEFDFSGGAEDMFYNISHPFKVIDEYGWKNFMLDEIVPNTSGNNNWIANYSWHLVGGGFRSRMMKEYYVYHGWSSPELMAWITMYSMHFTNEAVQQATLHAPVDPIADLYVFDFIGELLFGIDEISYISSRYLHLTDWTYQTGLDIQRFRFLNNGQLYWVRINIIGPLSGSILTGEQINSFGLTWDFSNERQLSVGFGGKAKSFKTTEGGTPKMATFGFTGGLYYSIDDNPLLVITYEPEIIDTDSRDYDPRLANEYSEKIILNLYPGVLKLFDRYFGLTFQYNNEAFYFGFSTTLLPVGILGSTDQKEKYERSY